MSLDLSKLLSESTAPQRVLLEQTRGLAKKWERTGLLEGLKNESERGVMAVMLENQAQQLVTENSRTGTAANAEQWSGVALPLVRKVFGEISAKEFVSVQPMNLPAGLIFYLDFQYGTGVAPRNVGDSVYGDTTSSAAPQGGLYGAGRFGYTINNVTSSFALVTPASASTVATSASVNFDTNVPPGQYMDITVPLANMPNADISSIRAWIPSGAFFTANQVFPAYTRLDALQQNVIFTVTSGSMTGGATMNIGKVTYLLQTTPTSRGDFEDTKGSSIPPNGVDLNIPEINIVLKQIPIVPKTRKLKAVWSPELAQDLNAFHSIDAEAELTAMLSEYISLEVDLEILEMLLVNAQTTGYWSAKIATIWNGSSFVADSNLAGQAWTTMTWYQTFGNILQQVSNTIHKLTLRGGANFVVVSPDLASILEVIPGFAAKTDGNQADFAMGVSQVGSFQNRFQVYKNPYLTRNVALVGFRGSNFLETGAVYAPYIPLIMTPLVYDPQNFTPRRGVLTRYAKQVVRPEFFAKIIVHGL